MSTNRNQIIVTITRFPSLRHTILAASCLLAFLGSVGCSELPTQATDKDAFLRLTDVAALYADGGLDGFVDSSDSQRSAPSDSRVRAPLDAQRIEHDATPDVGGQSDVGMLDHGRPMPDQSPPMPQGPALYPAGQTHSPMPRDIVARMREIHASDDRWQDDVFMKIGASSTVSRRTLHCFSGDEADLDGHDHLQDTLDFFLGGDAAGSTSFNRTTLAARVGHSANWVIAGDPSPVEQETAAIQPRFGLIHYGTNDMGLGATYATAMRGFFDNMVVLMDGLIAQGIIPILTGISRRGDRASANLWVGSYNAVIRGLAQSRQVPFIDLHHAVDPLDEHGLAGDGLHLNRYADGACILTPRGLLYGYNVRNLIVLETLDRLRRVLFGAEEQLDVAPRLTGAGDYGNPFEISALPFADGRDTRLSMTRTHSSYPTCDDANEAGPEFVYRYTTNQVRRIRAMVLDSGDVDIDIHLLDHTGRAAGCMDRNHHYFERTLQPGTYHFVLDTFTGRDGQELSGPYLFVLVACDDGDDACAD